jgi:AsmA protein
MKSLLKWLGITLGSLLWLAMLLSIAAVFLIDIEDYRDDIATAVADATGRTLTIDGNLELRSFPCCGIQIGEFSLSNAKGFPAAHFAKAEAASISIQVLPLLLSREVKLDVFSITGLDLQLVSRKDGKTNWNFSSADSPPEENDAEFSADNISTFDIRGVEIRDSRIDYFDAATNERIVFEVIDLNTDSIELDKAFYLSGQLRADGLVENALVDLQLNTQAALNSNNMSLSLNGLNFAANLQSEDYPGGAMAVEGTVAQVNGIGLESIDIKDLDVSVSTAGVNVQVSGTGNYDDSGLTMTGPLNVASFVPRELMQTLGEALPDTADPDVLKNLSLAGDWMLDGDTAKLENLSVQLDDSAVTGAVRIASIGQGAYRFDLQFDQLDADRYLSPESAVVAADSSGDASGSATETGDLPIDALRELNVDGRLRFLELKIMGMQLTNTDIRISADNGAIRLKPLTADLYDGSYSGDVQLNVRDSVPRLKVNEELRNVQVNKVTAALMNEAATLLGRGDMSFRGSATGMSTDALIDGLTGELLMTLKDGAYLGTDIWYEVRKAWALVEKEAPPPAPANPQTEIQSLSSVTRWQRGMLLENEQLAVRIPFMTINGNGLIDLNGSTLDYNLSGRVTEVPVFEDGSDMDKLKGVVLAMGLQGAIDAPGIKLDVGDLVGSVLKSTVERKKDKAVNRLLDKFGLGSNQRLDNTASAESSDNSDEFNELQPAQEGAELSIDFGQDPKQDSRDELKEQFRNIFGD